jgi:hypothetical protein
MHLIPRSYGAGLQVHSRTPGDPKRLAEIAQRIAEKLPAA